jgi:hypothetical protein
MFSSNQVLAISGDLSHDDELRNALSYALAQYACPHMPTSFQITPSGKYVLGWHKNHTGWIDFPFETSVEILVPIISAHVKKQKYLATGGGDGTYTNGFLIETVESWKSGEIVEPAYSIISIAPFVCYYAK